MEKDKSIDVQVLQEYIRSRIRFRNGWVSFSMFAEDNPEIFEGLIQILEEKKLRLTIINNRDGQEKILIITKFDLKVGHLIRRVADPKKLEYFRSSRDWTEIAPGVFQSVKKGLEFSKRLDSDFYLVPPEETGY